MRRSTPEVVRVANLARIAEPWLRAGRRNERALGKPLKPGQLSELGRPQRRKIYTTRRLIRWSV